MNEKPLERLNYYNGQRLEANDLKLEQEYHIRVRRWLNKSLFLAGIAEGLEVRPEVDDQGQSTSSVIVSPGLALDAEGREIILLEEERVPVMGKPSKIDGQVQENYLTIQYREETVAEDQGGCMPRRNGHDKSGNQIARGGPTRLRAKPILGWSDILPHEGSGKILLGQVELAENCKVRRVHAGVRRYIGAASGATLRQYALEGERHIDKANPARIYFHIRGGQQNAVTLYLRADKFSSLYYTEMGKHSHPATVSGGTGPASPELLVTNTQHQHDVSLTASADTQTVQTAKHTHTLTAREGYLGRSDVSGVPGAKNKGQGLGQAGFFLIESGWPVTAPPSPSFVPHTDTNVYDILGEVAGSIEGGGEHSHPVTGKTELYTGFEYKHTHTISGTGGTGDAGVTDPSPPAYTAHPGDPLTYVDDLQVYIDGTDPLTNNQTQNILSQLQHGQLAINWEAIKLGDGTANHPIVVDEHDPRVGGTGAIKIDYLPNLTLAEGEHFIELRVTRGGARILYNLYVE